MTGQSGRSSDGSGQLLGVRTALSTAVVAVICLGGVQFATAEESATPDFNRDIRPILANACWQCHGPDAAERQADLRLDEATAATAELPSGSRAIVPGDWTASELAARVSATDSDLVMPPLASGKPQLTQQEVALLKRWIAAGATYQPHWAFVPPQQHPLPAEVNEAEGHAAIDFFVRRALAEKGLSPAPSAQRTKLLRRVTLDLTGLPPTIGEVDAFLADDRPDAYARVVDRLLASPRFGEHFGRQWLDAARYADTHGLHLDNRRTMWLYRDWVIHAFNDNLPFDQFLIQQLAGDLLPQPTLEDRIATGFNRCNVSTNEGGSILEEVYVRNTIDRVETTSTVFLGLTAGCAACHDHKFDPLTQKEFYQLFAFFNSNTEEPMDGNAEYYPPVVAVPSQQQADAQAENAAQLAKHDAVVAALLKERTAAYVDPSPDISHAAEEPADFVWVDDAFPQGTTTRYDGHAVQFVHAKDGAPVFSGTASHTRSGQGRIQHYFTGASRPLLVGEGDRLFVYAFLDEENPPETVQLQFHAAGSWEHRAHWGADKGHGQGTSGVSFFRAGDLPATGQWVRLEVAASDVGLAPGTTIDGWAFTQFGGKLHWDAAGIVTKTPQPAANYASFAEWSAMLRVLTPPPVPKSLQTAAKKPSEKRSEAEQADLLRHFVQQVCSSTRTEFAELDSKRAALVRARDQLATTIPKTMVMREADQPRKAFVLSRGQYDAPGEEVTREVPDWLPPLPEDAPRNRLGFAQWLVADGHPLTARVTVNRFWQAIFGRGLVATPEDFGVQGAFPTHPELLDWLAVDFRRHGWDVKRLIRQMVLSKTYRQASRCQPETLRLDPENRWLARGPRYRLDAEVLRDAALFASGLMVEQIGGPSVKPYQPEGVWFAVGYSSSNTARFKRDAGNALYRRSMYTFWKRTAPPPTMAMLDAPSRESCTVRRARTNTPLAALALMNDEQFVEAARHLAQRVLTEAGADTSQRLRHLFRLVLAREPSPREFQLLQQQLDSHREHFAAHPTAAAKLLAVGESPRDTALAEEHHAAWTMLASLVLNLDEASFQVGATMHPLRDFLDLQTRRAFLKQQGVALGAAALSSLLGGSVRANDGIEAGDQWQQPYQAWKNGTLPHPHHRPTAKRVIYLFMSGAPSQLDLFEHKPKLADRYDQDLPESVRQGQRLTTMTSGQARFPVAPSIFKFAQHGESGMWLSELLPTWPKLVDDVTFIRSMWTEAINHDPAITYMQTGHQIPGRPSAGAWLQYGLGSPNDNLPAFVVMTPKWSGRPEAQALYSRLWGSGFLPSQHQGVALRAKGDPVLFLSDPPGVDRATRRRMLDGLAELNAMQADAEGDPETLARTEQYEMAFRMQTSVPELTDFSDESPTTLKMYGPDVHEPGTFAASCLLARRLAERGVPFTQIFIRGWDHHFTLPKFMRGSCQDIDRPTVALIQDLKERGMFDDTLVLWGGEFGRTVYCQGKLTKNNYGRDHHPKCFTMFAAGGGIKRGHVHGATDDYSYNITADPVHIHDLNATMLHCLGLDHTRLTYRFQGRDFRLTDVHGRVVREILA